MRASFRIGPAGVAVAADSPLKNPQHELFAQFQTGWDEGRTPDLTVRVHDDPAPAEKGLPLVGENEGSWRLFHRAEGGWRLEILDPLTRSRAEQIALISPGFDRADLHRVPSGGWHLAGVMTTFVQWWMTGWLALGKRGMLLHGCAAAWRETALAFIGPSGAGKTTLARLCLDGGKDKAEILNDERIIVWEEAEGWRVSGTPWPGMLWKASAATFPLAGFFALKKAPQNRIIPLPPLRFLTRLIPEAFHPVWDRQAMEGLLAAAGRLVEQEEIPMGEFQFPKDPSAVEFLQGFLKPPVLL